MSYDIHLKDPVTEEIAKVPGHLMAGGTFRADYHPETGTFTPALNTEANLNITYIILNLIIMSIKKAAIKRNYS